MLKPVVLEELTGVELSDVELSGVDVGNNVVVMGVVLSCLFLCLCLCACSVKSKKSKKKRTVVPSNSQQNLQACRRQDLFYKKNKM